MEHMNSMPYPIKIENEPKFGVGGENGAMGGMFGGAGLGGLLFGLLLGNRSGGLFGGGNQDPMAALALGQLSDIKAAVPLAAAQTEASIARSENALSNQANQNLIATLQAINSVSSKVDASTITSLQSELAEARAGYHSRGAEVSVNQSVNQAQAQSQMQQQLNGLHSALAGLIVQNQRSAQDIVNIGGRVDAAQTAVQR
jgi:hypothetical protein